MNCKHVALCASVVISTFSLAGCGDDGPPMAAVSGTVTLDGKSVEGAVVVFTSPTAPANAIGTTDASGKFVLQTLDKPGATIGDHQVSITKPDPSVTSGDIKTVEVSGSDSVKGSDAPSGASAFKAKSALPSSTGGGMMIPGQMNKKPKVNSLLPEKYADPKTSGFKASVVKGKENTFDFPMTGK